MELRPLNEILHEPWEIKTAYIKGDLSMAVNEQLRGSSDNYKNLRDIHRHIFNTFNERPKGELSELKSTVASKRSTKAMCLGELSDCLYYSMGLDRGLCLAGESGMTPKIFLIGKKLRFSPVQVIDGCIIKYNSRAMRKQKLVSHELNALEDYLGGDEAYNIPRMQKRRTIKEIAKVISLGGYYLKFITQQNS